MNDTVGLGGITISPIKENGTVSFSKEDVELISNALKEYGDKMSGTRDEKREGLLGALSIASLITDCIDREGYGWALLSYLKEGVGDIDISQSIPELTAMKGRKRPKSSSMDQRQKAILSFAMSMFMNSGETEESAAKEVCRKIYFYDFKLLHKEKGKIDWKTIKAWRKDCKEGDKKIDISTRHYYFLKEVHCVGDFSEKKYREVALSILKPTLIYEKDS